MDMILITIFVFVAIMVITALVFGGWLMISILRLLGRGIGALLGLNRQYPPPLPPGPPHTIRCGFDKCRAINADRARFCRRCGKVLNVSASPRPLPPLRRSPIEAVEQRVMV
jgi:hypothetical protein